MKKTIVLGAVLLGATAGYGQVSRQDASVSLFGLVPPVVHGNGITLTPSDTGGILLSYRYLLTPHSALEANYGFAQNTNYFQSGGNQTYNPIHSRQQEFSLAYVYSRTYRKYTPFVEGGPGAMFFSPIHDNGTYNIDVKQNVNIGAVFGGGLAYEVSPSFDIRVEYRGMFVKAPDYKLPNDIFKTNRYMVTSMPAIGVAYHF